jgi:hypothetical protein
MLKDRPTFPETPLNGSPALLEKWILRPVMMHMVELYMLLADQASNDDC